jgi:hypothetical protein
MPRERFSTTTGGTGSNRDTIREMPLKKTHGRKNAELQQIASLAAVCLIGFAAIGEVRADVKIGAVLSVTGPASFLGDPERKTLDMYVA